MRSASSGLWIVTSIRQRFHQTVAGREFCPGEDEGGCLIFKEPRCPVCRVAVSVKDIKRVSVKLSQPFSGRITQRALS